MKRHGWSLMCGLTLVATVAAGVAVNQQPYLVKDINPAIDPTGRPGTSTIDFLGSLGGTVLFAGDDGTTGAELWRTDGTDAGTVLVKDIRPGRRGSTPLPGIVWNGLVYFVADDGVHGLALWRTDGTAGGTQLVRALGFPPGSEINPLELRLICEQLTATAETAVGVGGTADASGTAISDHASESVIVARSVAQEGMPRARKPVRGPIPAAIEARQPRETVPRVR